MLPLVLVLAGVAALVAGIAAIGRLGPGVRVGRILATTPIVPVKEARGIASAGRPRYVGVRGRIDAEEPFEDDAHRPLVFRRTRLEARVGERWSVLQEDRRGVPFVIAEGLDSIAVDTERLAEGVVVVAREATGTAAELPDGVPDGMPSSTSVRLRIEQVSAVEHAIVLGVPAPDASGGAVLTAGLGRPLVLTTLEPAEAMRILGGGRRTTSLTAAVLLGLGAVAVTVGALWALVDALA